jgi:hypothetical protein
MNASEFLRTILEDRDVKGLERQLAADVKQAVNAGATLSERQQHVVRGSIFESTSTVTHRDFDHAMFVMTMATYINSCR